MYGNIFESTCAYAHTQEYVFFSVCQPVCASHDIQVHSLGVSLDLSVLVHLCTIFPLCQVVFLSVVDILSTWSKENNIFYLLGLVLKPILYLQSIYCF